MEPDAPSANFYPMGSKEFLRLLRLAETGLISDWRSPELDELCTEARAHFGVASAAVTILDKDFQYIRARSGIEASSTPRCVAFCNYTILENDVFVVEDTLLRPEFRNNPLVTGDPFLRFYAGAALVFSRDLTLGAFCILDPKPRAFSRADQAELADFADRAVSVIRRWVLAQDRS